MKTQAKPIDGDVRVLEVRMQVVVDAENPRRCSKQCWYYRSILRDDDLNIIADIPQCDGHFTRRLSMYRLKLDRKGRPMRHSQCLKHGIDA